MNTNYTITRKDYKELCQIEPDFKDIEDDIEEFFEFNDYIKKVMRTDNDNVVNIAKSYFFKKEFEKATSGQDDELLEMISEAEEKDILNILMLRLANKYGYTKIDKLIYSLEKMIEYFSN